MSLENMEERTQGMKNQAQELIKQAYNRGYKEGQELREVITFEKECELIEQGRNEAWEAARKIYLSENNGGLPANELRKIFDVEWYSSIIKNLSVSEVVEKLHAYEERQKKKEQQKQKESSEIHVGDEVRWLINPDCIGIVTYVNYQNNMIWIMGHDGRHFIGGSHEIEKYEKTGRHFSDMDELIKKMQEGE